MAGDQGAVRLTQPVVPAAAEDFLRGLGDGEVGAIITDPPYFFDKMAAGWRGGDAPSRTAGQAVTNLSAGMAFRPTQARELAAWFLPLARAFHRVLKPGAFALVCSAPRLAHGFCLALEDAGFGIRDCAGWAHNAGQFKAGNLRRFGVEGDRRVPMLRPMHETIVVAQKAADGTLAANWQTHRVGLIAPTDVRGAPPASLLSHPKPGAEERRRGGHHPTPKPESLMEDLMHIFTQEGDLVVDPFAGSGTTGVAAVRSGRRFMGCDIDPAVASAASQRIAA